MLVPGFVSHSDAAWDFPPIARLFERLGTFARVVVFDKRGTGASDRGVELTIEGYVADLKAVMDACDLKQPAILGISEGGSAALLFAATYPERTSALIVYGGYARLATAPDYPLGATSEQLLASADYVAERWGTGVGLRGWAPSLGSDDESRRFWGQFQRLAASPRDIKAIMSAYAFLDVRPALGAISAPTLVIHRKGDIMVPVALGRYIADNVSGAKFLELEGSDHLFFAGDPDQIVDAVEEFLTGARHAPEPTRRLATVLFTDIVGSTERASSLGDETWRTTLERHDAMVRRALARFSGREIKSTGDGFLAIFEGPTAAIRCAESIRGGAMGLGLDVRIGIHTGEIELMGDDVGGIGVHIASRVADLPGPGEIWVSATVPGVVVGSGIEFAERGSHTLKGIPGTWPIFAVESA
ncbi:MAG: adenylate/guanylate cyclase domain-containing protein [Candidatus Dormiibacterota bacterium]